jgi:mannose-6-phosphate isomerase-like protein (cupin superfamily)
MLIDRYLQQTPEASTRMFRVYRPSPPHFHEHCDEHLLVVSGRGSFWAGDSSNSVEFGPGTLLVFKRRTVHAMPVMLEEPIVFLALDTPPRDPADVHFVDPRDGTAQSFISERGEDD